MKIVKYFFEFVSIISLFCIFKIIGLRNASNLGSILGKFIGPLFRSKNIITQNIRNGLGKIDKEKIKCLKIKVEIENKNQFIEEIKKII